jgi:circadian clock protein KaiB
MVKKKVNKEKKKSYTLKLFITGNTPNSIRAIANLKKVLANELKGMYTLQIVDVLKDPQLAEDEKILATPTLSRVLPPPIRRIIGDLSDREKVLIGLDIV